MLKIYICIPDVIINFKDFAFQNIWCLLVYLGMTLLLLGGVIAISAKSYFRYTILFSKNFKIREDSLASAFKRERGNFQLIIFTKN